MSAALLGRSAPAGASRSLVGSDGVRRPPFSCPTGGRPLPGGTLFIAIPLGTVRNLTVANLLLGREDPLSAALDVVDPRDELANALAPVAAGETPPSLQTTGYVVHSLQTALHDGLNADSAEAAIVTAVNRGGDTDTIGAIAGAVAGARFGADATPDRWLETLDGREELFGLAGRLRLLGDR